MLNIGNHPHPKTFFTLLHFFDVEDQRESGAKFTEDELNKLLLGPAKQGQLKSFLHFATELGLLVCENHQSYTTYSKGTWLPLWTNGYTHQQLVVLFFVKLGARLQSWDQQNKTENANGYDLIFSLCWILLLRPQRFQIGEEFNDSFEYYLGKHRTNMTELNLSAKEAKTGFRYWCKELGLMDDKYLPMNIFSDAMVEYIRSLEPKYSDIRQLLKDHLFLFSQANPIIQNIYSQLRDKQVIDKNDELSEMGQWTILSSVAWSLQQRKIGKKIQLKNVVSDGMLVVVFDPELAEDTKNHFGEINWNLV